MAAAALLACSKEQVIEQNRANDEIGFSVVAENQTKAEDVYTSTNTMEAFTVSATYTITKNDGSTSTSWYFQNDLITKVQNGENSAWENTTDTRYWSADGKHDFYAIVNGEMTMAATPAAPTVNFTPKTTVKEQKDLLYAVAAGQEKSNDPVELKFRHALSQIQFKAKNTNPNLHVKISGVQVGNIPGEGTFTYPTKSTNLTTETVVGEWTYTTPTDYTVTFDEGDEVDVAGNNTSVPLTCTPEYSMLLIPAETTAWAPTTGGGNNGEEGEGGANGGDGGEDDGFGEKGEDPEPPIPGGSGQEPAPDPFSMSMRRYNTASAGASDVTGSYLAVKCQIYNVAGTGYASTDVCIYNGWAMIPAAFDWAQGNKYIYTFVFGEGDFGYNGGNGDTPTPDEEKVLTSMNYTVKVDDFTDVETEKNMETL